MLTDGRTDRRTSSIHKPGLLCNPAKNGDRRYSFKYLVFGRVELYFVKEHSDSKSKYTEEDIIKMLEFLV